MEVILGMFFLTLNNTDIQFAKKELIWRSYTTKKTLPTTCWVEFINQKEFTKAVLDENVKAFVVYVAFLTSKMLIHPAQKAQIALLIAKEVIVPAEYSDFADVFSKKSAEMLLKHIGINKHAIKLEDGKQLPHGPIYSLGPMKLKTLKTYIKTNLAYGFIRPSKSPAGAPILFVCKPNSSLQLYVNYQDLNYLTIKNQYLLLLIGESLDWLEQAKSFTQLDLTTVYHRMRIKKGDK